LTDGELQASSKHNAAAKPLIGPTLRTFTPDRLRPVHGRYGSTATDVKIFHWFSDQRRSAHVPRVGRRQRRIGHRPARGADGHRRVSDQRCIHGL